MSKRSAQRHRQEVRRNQRQADAREERAYSADTIPTLPAAERQALAVVEEAVERAKKSKIGVDQSRQPRFTEPLGMFMGIYHWAHSCVQSEPQSHASMQEWDVWRRNFCFREPFLAGVFNSVVQIDTNRGYTITGGRNQVNKFTKRFHQFRSNDNTAGWRPFVNWLSQSYYLYGMGFVGEVGSDTEGGPLVACWGVDPAQCILTGIPETPLRYKDQDWTEYDYFRGASLLSTDETLLGYGYPAIARCYDLAKLMVGILDHDMQKVNMKTPDAILTGKNISEEQWRAALEAREETLRGSRGEGYLNSIATIMSSGGDAPEFALTMLSSLPDRWDFRQWCDLLMYGYANAFGYDPREFWPVSGGQLGTATETDMQHRKSTSKGDKDFSLNLQEQLQKRLPETIEFKFETRDVDGEISDANLAKAKAEVIETMTKWTAGTHPTETSVLNAGQIMQLAVEQNLIPEDWVPEETEVTATDEEPIPESPANVSERVERAMRAFPDEPIVRYTWPENKTRTLKVRVRRSFPVPDKRFSGPNAKLLEAMFVSPKQLKDDWLTVRAIQSRQNPADSIIEDYERQLEELVKQAQAHEITKDEMIDKHRALILATADAAYLAGLEAGGEAEPEIADEDRIAVEDWTNEQMLHVGDFADDTLMLNTDEGRKKLQARILLWGAAVGALALLGLTTTRDMLVFDGQDGVESCRTCQKLKGKKHRASWWRDRGLIPGPGNKNFECGGWNCQHTLTPVSS